MLDIVASHHFKRDLKLLLRRNCDMKLLDSVISQLAAGEPLAEKYRDHLLSGDYGGFRECHITSDWLLVYQIRDSELILYLSRTGTHSDLF